MKHSLLPIILGAFPPETSELRLLLEGRPQIIVRDTGIGSIQAAANSAQLLCEIALTNNSPVVIFIGSCGSAKRNIPLGTTVLTTGTRMVDAERASGRGYIPKLVRNFIPADEKLVSLAKAEFGHEVHAAEIYSSPCITADEQTAETLSRFASTPFENLEVFGIATACTNAGVPWLGISCVTNYLGPNAHSEWKANMSSAAKTTALLVQRFLEALR